MKEFQDQSKVESEFDQINVISHPSKTYRSFRRILSRVLNICLSSFYFGYTLAYFGSFNFDVLTEIFEIDNNIQLNKGLLTGAVTIGSGIGALSSSILLKKLSRRNSLLFVNTLAVLAGSLIMIPNLIVLYGCRSLQGICSGMFSALVPLLIKEFSPKQLAGSLGALNQTFLALGIFFAYFFQMLLSFESDQLNHWRISFGFTLITIIIQSIVLLTVFKQQTPKYYLLQNNKKKCEQILRKIYLEEFVEKILIQKKQALGMERWEEDLEESNYIQLKEISLQKQFRQKISQGSNKYKNGKPTRIKVAIHIAILQQMAGINSINSYGVEIAQQIIPNLKIAIPSILGLEQVVATLFSSYLLSKLGRKSIMQFGTMNLSLSLVIITIGFVLLSQNIAAGGWLILCGLILFVAIFGLSLGPITWIYIADIVEAEVIPFPTLSNRLTSAVITITFPILKNAFNSSVPLFAFYGVWTFCSFFVNSRYVLETKGKTQKQIYEGYGDI